jgi:two-component system, cell cycle sensor histidine kinase and response regulator CckA
MPEKPTHEAFEQRILELEQVDFRRKQAEYALRESESLVSSIFRAAPTGIGVVSNRILLTVNDRLCDMIGYSREEMIGQSARMLYPSDAQFENVGTEKYRQIFQYGTGTVETQWRCKDGRILDILMSSTPISSTDLAAGVTFTALDITERKKSEEALRDSEKKYRLIAENTADLISVLDMNLHFTYISPGIMRLRGFTVDEAMSQTLEQVLTPESMRIALSAFEEVMIEEASGSADLDRTLTLELEAYKKDASTVWMEVSLSFLRDKDHKPDAILIVSRDITDRKRADVERKSLQSQLLQAQKMESVGRLAGGVAHDFNNMLQSISGHAEMALDKIDPAHPLHGNLSEIAKAARRSADLTRQLLAFARKQTINPIVLDLNQTISGMLKMLHRLIGENIDFSWKPALHLWPTRIDPSQIDQILVNLCVNASDAISGVGSVTIKTENVRLDQSYRDNHAGFVPGEYVLIAVGDTGAGMEKDILDQIFEPFFTTKETGKGTGLGLSTVYGIVKQNNGFIYVYSEPGKGATFEIYLPRFVGDAMKPTDKGKVEAPRSQGETVLLVEDEPMILDVSREMLEQLGYAVLTAGTPDDALRLAKTHTDAISLLITDVVMPDINGRDLAELICNIKPGMKNLFISGYTADVIAHHGVLNADVHFLQKPFSIKQLAVKVREVLGIARLIDN